MKSLRFSDMHTNRYILLFSSVLIMIICIIVLGQLQLRFSVSPGFYRNDIDLEIRGGLGGAAQVFYTLDGSTPSRESIPYAGKIHLGNASKNENVYSARQDISTSQLTDHNIYPVPTEKIDKCNIVRAAIITSEGDILSEISGSFFIGLEEEKYKGLRVVSVITDSKNLFDYNKGIYVVGRSFDDYKKKIEESGEELGTYWQGWEANYNLDRRRECFVEMYDVGEIPNRTKILNSRCHMKIRGNTTRAHAQKSISFIADKNKIEGVSEFQSKIFNNDRFPHKFLMFSGGSNSYKLADIMINTLSSELSFSTMKLIPAAMFLDGEYWGTYFVSEDYDKDYFSDYYGVSPDNLIMFKSVVLKEGEEEDEGTYSDMINFVTEQELSKQGNYKEVEKIIDIDSFIDYYAMMIFIARNVDWPNANEGVWRTRNNDGTYYGV